MSYRTIQNLPANTASRRENASSACAESMEHHELDAAPRANRVSELAHRAYAHGSFGRLPLSTGASTAYASLRSELADCPIVVLGPGGDYTRRYFASNASGRLSCSMDADCISDHGNATPATRK